ncbi:MAG TPA: peptidylprolyl isomerase [Patescibacteria group bacterium]|nr:peptidylprolyl isomerase [Patescibacteria group bacterium]
MKVSGAWLLVFAACLGTACSTASTTDPAAAGSAATPPAAQAATPPPEEHLSSVVAEVNGRPLYRAFYDQSLNFMRNRLNAGQDATTVERYLNAKFDALDRLVDDELIYQEAQNEGIAVTEANVQEEFKRACAGSGGEERFLSIMRQQGISKFDALEGIRRRLTINRFMKEKVTAGMTATDEEALGFYNANLQKFTPELWVKLFQITVLCPRNAPTARTEQARARAVKILANIRAGEPFEAMAKEFSEDRSASVGGNTGFVKRGATYPEFDAVIFTMKPGEVSEVLRTDSGFHIVKVVERRGGTPVPFENSKEECRRAILAQKQADAVRSIASRLRASAKITTHLD